MSLLYAVGERPAADDLARLLDEPVTAPAQAARISHRPDSEEGWLELLASGLTLDIVGLSPSASRHLRPGAHFFGLSPQVRGLPLEAVTIVPGGHVAAGAALIPVVRVMCGLGLRLASLGNVRAVCWHPGQSWMEPGYYARIIGAWLDGGAFPALGLTALERNAEGELESSGLAFFTGQELLVEPRAGETAAVTARLAVRLIDLLVRKGRLQEATRISGPEGEELAIEPSDNGEVIRVRRGK